MAKKRSLESAGLSDAEYLDIMERVAADNYKSWKLPSEDVALLQALNDNTYNYKEYYNKYPNSKANANIHWTDEFKTVYHPTFSDESIYSGKKSQYNPKGITGGHWYGDTFVPSKDQVKERRGFKDGGKVTSYVTTGGAGYVPPINMEGLKSNIKKKVYNYITGGLPVDTVRQRLYNNLFQGYDAGITRVIDNLKRVRNAVVDNKQEINETNILRYRQSYMDDLLAEYLQIPANKRRNFFGRNHLENSPYKPKISKDNVNYKRIVNGYAVGHSGLHPSDEEKLINAAMKGEYTNAVDAYSANKGYEQTTVNHGPVGLNKSVTSKVLQEYGLGTHTISRGRDKKGEYISYYDLWDMAPSKHSGGNRDESMGIGKPVHVYDRIYLDDFYGVPDESAGGNYIPEIVVIGNRKKQKDGGSIHIAPSKRGTFTAAATKHGMSVQEFASRVLRNKDNYSPAMVKKANFAHNASKWNH